MDIAGRPASASETELREIDENLIRTNLSLAEEAIVIARRKEIYEQQHPETKKENNNKKRDKLRSATGRETAMAAPRSKYREWLGCWRRRSRTKYWSPCRQCLGLNHR
jgi:hypothetical protein